MRDADRLTFICECSDEGCLGLLELTLDEYEGVRADPRCFAVLPGHDSHAEGVVGSFDHFVIVEKLGAARAVAERTDPRGRRSD